MPKLSKKGRLYNEMMDDESQTHFTKRGKAKLPVKVEAKVTLTHDPTMPVLCPFCLYMDKLQQFYKSTKRGISHTMAQCPACGQGMRMESLTADMTPEQYAEWCYEYSGSGFWKKVQFEKWKKRLWEIGWASRFWRKYKELKGDSDVESYSDHFERKQREWAIEQGYTEG